MPDEQVAPSDPVNFIPADVLFLQKVPDFKTPGQVINIVPSDSNNPENYLRYAAGITLQGVSGDQDTYCLVQFVTPYIWRVRYDPRNKDLKEYSNVNSRTIVQDSFSKLVDDLQQETRDSSAWNSPDVGKDWFWNTTFVQQPTADGEPRHWILSSKEYKNSTDAGTVVTNLHFLENPFRIVATRVLQPRPFNTAETGIPDQIQSTTLTSAEKVIWMTSPNTFRYLGDSNASIINNVVMNINKPTSADYVGFGEQGGRTVLKKPTYMNYFCYDNYNYRKVYNIGALDPQEPLYHSTPFFLEMNGSPDYLNVTGLMVDNYSQVAMDLGKGNSSTIGVATRFGTFDAYIMTADDAPKMIWQYTSLVGRPKLKPRYALGHHQGCYGYDHDTQVEGIVNGYRKEGIPLDGMHLDVDFQDRYRTFTVNQSKFPNPSQFLGNLRALGVKCCTNITPILTLREWAGDEYTNLHAFWDENDKLNPATNLLVADKRYTEGGPEDTQYTRYDLGGYAVPSYANPNNNAERVSYADDPTAPVYTDLYQLKDGNWNSGYPFHGGVSYGTNLGTPGYYPDLNRAATRDKWGEQYQTLFNYGLEFVWQDMTTPAVANCYGDMLGFPSRLLMSEDTYDQKPDEKPSTKTAIELWSLYSYNLHKATYHGLNKLQGRQNKRNFIIGRGSQTGMHRFAGLWTGDNASSWDFWRISVAQVLALGYSGLTIAGSDMGGFTSDPANQSSQPRWCDPELLIRWYSGAFLLPWYRNHYNQKFDKAFQEPWQYNYALSNYSAEFPNPSQAIRDLYGSVSPICKYFVQLRYSLMQVLYDAMFANLIHGLPIARAMIITDPHDTTLYNANDDFIDTQYLLGHNILVCPVLDPLVTYMNVYLPGSDNWFPSNLRVNNYSAENGPADLKYAATLRKAVPGGTTIRYYCPLPTPGNMTAQVPYTTPVYIRAGAIIPQLDVRQYIGEDGVNPVLIHIYPSYGNPSSYSMYLDDGVSRDSAPSYLPQFQSRTSTVDNRDAHSKYREVKITQEYHDQTRVIKLSHPWNQYDPSPQVGSTYSLAIWTVSENAPPSSQVTISYEDANGQPISNITGGYNSSFGVVQVTVPIDAIPSTSDNQPPPFIAIKVSGL